MELDHFCIKFFINLPAVLPSHKLIEIFHGWIQHQKLDHQMVDVADYSHVPRGSGVLLKGYEYDVSVEPGKDNKNGLLYRSWISNSNTTEQRLGHAWYESFKAARLFGSDFAKDQAIVFDSKQFVIQVNDRMLAPNTIQTWEKYESHFQSGLASSLGHTQFRLSYVQNDPRELFSISVQLDKELAFN